tara:strand:- start:1050 stop:2159 length:1110 start_codon:yes stop_codon:yes gene_type:complete
VNIFDESEWEVLREIRKTSQNTPIVFLSNEYNITFAINAIKEGAYDCIMGPYNKRRFLHTIEQAIYTKQHSEKVFNLLNSATQVPLQEALVDLNLTGDTMLQQLYFDQLKGELGDIFDILLEFYEKKYPEGLLFYKLFEEQFSSFIHKKRSLNTTPHILVIDYNQQDRNHHSHFLSDYNVHQAGSKEHAIDIITNNTQIQFVLLTIPFPDHSELTFIKQLNKTLPKVVIILLTDFKHLDLAVTALNVGASDYLNKPVVKSELLSMISLVQNQIYFKEFFMNFKKKFIQNYLSEEMKHRLLEQLVKNRTIHNRDIFMRDIYLVFPELDCNTIADDSIISNKIFKNGISEVITSFQKKTIDYSQIIINKAL